MADVTCNNCGTEVADDTHLPTDQRTPCPNCGALERRVHVTAHAAAYATAGAVANVQPAELPNVLMQTIIVPAGKTPEGMLIASVAVPWFKVIEILKRDPAAAFQIPSHKWEEIVAGAYREAGFDEVTLTPRSGDYGRDVIAVKKGLGIVRVIDQVKAYKPDLLVTANDVRALIGVLHGDGASKGFLTTTSDFAPKLRSDPLITPFFPARLELINGTALLARLQELAEKGSK